MKGVNHKQDILGINCEALAKALKEKLELFGIHRSTHVACVILEKVWLMKGQGISTGSTFMDNYGRLKAILDCAVGGRILVTPQVWQKGLFGGPAATKEVAKQYVKVNLVGYEKLIPSGCSVIPDGLSDSFCMAEYGRRTYG